MNPDQCSNPLSRREIAEQLGRLYRHARILRRLLRLLEDAERQELPLLTADRLDLRKGGAPCQH
ncbi:MAG: hypothetical protein K8T89_22085 [Planctomycetes bacterium]|nr:hypothetical protein [Planctomycetota bacterium]